MACIKTLPIFPKQYKLYGFMRLQMHQLVGLGCMLYYPCINLWTSIQ